MIVNGGSLDISILGCAACTHAANIIGPLACAQDADRENIFLAIEAHAVCDQATTVVRYRYVTVSHLRGKIPGSR